MDFDLARFKNTLLAETFVDPLLCLVCNYLDSSRYLCYCILFGRSSPPRASAMLCYYGLSYSASNLSDDVHLNFILVMYDCAKVI